MKELQNYEFHEPGCSGRVSGALEMLKKAMMETFFKDLQQQIL